ncbi:hypothetical protein [Litorisediminicola beolgyonensis]|uniref:Lipoprotein n=1 Tax=Litorisediminicola beolgyonensis TaxID=1173614 RepID=A0ABW3ZMA8_9RHOB
MTKKLTLLIVAALVLTSCGRISQSRFNPLNWFGAGQSVPVQTSDGTNPLLPQRNRAVSVFRTEREEVATGFPIAQVTELLVERRPGGAIIRATGVAERAGPWNARLTPVETGEAGVLAYSFDVLLQSGPAAVPARTRMVTVARALTDQELAGITTIRVSGRSNALASRR